MNESGETTGANGRPTWGRFGYRSVDDRYVAGVAGGLSERVGVDPFFLRAGLISVTLFLTYNGGPYGFLPVGYLLAWVFLPVEDEPSVFMNGKGWQAFQEAAGALALCVLVLVLLSNPSFLETAVLAVVAYALLRDPARRRRPARPMPAASAAPGPGIPGEPAASSAPPQDPPPTSSEEPTAKWGRTRRAERERRFEPRARRSRREPALWPTTLALLVSLAVAFATLDNLVDGGINPAIFVNAALIVIGGIILLSAWKGRAQWTVLLALGLVPLWIAFSVTDIGRFSGDGIAYYPASAPVGDEPLTFEHGYGATDINLLRLDMEPGDEVTVESRLTAGDMNVIVPAEYDLYLTSEIGLGGQTIFFNSFGVWEHKSVPAVARTMRQHYPARAIGCDSAFLRWPTLLNMFAAAGVDLDDATSEVDEEAVLAALDAIEDRGYTRPVYEGHRSGVLDNRFHDENGHHYLPMGAPIPDGLPAASLEPLEPTPYLVEQSPFEQAEAERMRVEAALRAGEDVDMVPTPAPIPIPNKVTYHYGTSWYIVDGGFYDESGRLGAPAPTPTQFSPDSPAPTPRPFVSPDELPLNPGPVVVPPVEGGLWHMEVRYNTDSRREACKREPLPENPPVIHLDATVGLGSLTIERTWLR